MKKKLETICVVIVLILSIANIKLCADAINALNDNTEKKYISQGDIKSKQYLVQEGYISRITPKTEVGVFVEQIGLENIEIYRNTEKEEKIESGLVATGMVMTLEETDYELSIVGDINRDGRANIVEAVQIINHIVELEGKELTGLSYMSGDINGDKEINIIDVSKLIRYIVFEELEIGEVEWEEPPVEEKIPEKQIGKIYAIEDLVDLTTMVNNGTFEEEYRKVHGEETEIVVTLERDLDFKDAKSYRTENPDTEPYKDAEENGIDANGDGTVEPIMVELTTGLGFIPIGTVTEVDQNMGMPTGNSFKGIFNGNENTIYNLYISRPEEMVVGLFGIIDSETTIENLGLTGYVFNNMGFAGGILGMAFPSSEECNIVIKNCHINNIEIKSGMSSAGICGLIMSQYDTSEIIFENCLIGENNSFITCERTRGNDVFRNVQRIRNM